VFLAADLDDDVGVAGVFAGDLAAVDFEAWGEEEERLDRRTRA
jgi:hypothetical protein